MRDSLEALFEAAGLQVTTFPSARQFLDAMASPAGCLVADVRMPDMDGLQLLAELAARPGAHPVIVITGHGDVPMAVKAMKLGAADFIEKYFATYPGVMDYLVETLTLCREQGYVTTLCNRRRAIAGVPRAPSTGRATPPSNRRIGGRSAIWTRFGTVPSTDARRRPG